MSTILPIVYWFLATNDGLRIGAPHAIEILSIVNVRPVL